MQIHMCMEHTYISKSSLVFMLIVTLVVKTWLYVLDAVTVIYNPVVGGRGERTGRLKLAWAIKQDPVSAHLPHKGFP